MGASAAQTVSEIEEIRGRIESEFQELERRMPRAGVWLKRGMGLLLGGGAALILLRFMLRRRRARSVVQGDGWVMVRAEDLRRMGVRRVALRG